MFSKRLGRAYTPPVPAGQVVQWVGNPPNDAGVLPLSGQAFNPAHFPELLAQHGDAVLPNKAPVDGIHSVVGHGQQGTVTLAVNDSDVDFSEIIHDFGEQILGFKTNGETIIVWGDYGKVWGSTDGGTNFVQLPLYLNSGSTGSNSTNRRIFNIEFGNGVWVASFGDYIAICRGDILTPAEWQALPYRFGSLTNGVSSYPFALCTDGNGKWMAAGKWHQFAWTTDDWQTINVTEQPNGSNGATLLVPFNNGSYYGYPAYCFCLDGNFFAGSLYTLNPQKSPDLITWSNVIQAFNTGRTDQNQSINIVTNLGAGHYLVAHAGYYFAESFDYGETWIRRAYGLGSGFSLYGVAADQQGFAVATASNGGTVVWQSKDNAVTIASAGFAAALHADPQLVFWRGAWYGMNSDRTKIVRSLTGYVRTEWEVAP